MADASEGAPKAAATAIEAAKKALDALQGEKGTEEKPKAESAPPEVRAGLDSGAMEAVQRFRKTTHWILGAFVAVGVVLFGSLPFTDITKEGRNTPLIVIGLALAASGITLAIWAVSRVDEPEDSSLGELKADLPKASNNWFRPPSQALNKLKGELGGADGENHVGPMHPDARVPTDKDPAERHISGLIASIGKAQVDRYVFAADAAEAARAYEVSKEVLAARTNELETAWNRLVKTLEFARPTTTPSTGKSPKSENDS